MLKYNFEYISLLRMSCRPYGQRIHDISVCMKKMIALVNTYGQYEEQTLLRRQESLIHQLRGRFHGDLQDEVANEIIWFGSIMIEDCAKFLRTKLSKKNDE